MHIRVAFQLHLFLMHLQCTLEVQNSSQIESANLVNWMSNIQAHKAYDAPPGSSSKGKDEMNQKHLELLAASETMRTQQQDGGGSTGMATADRKIPTLAHSILQNNRHPPSQSSRSAAEDVLYTSIQRKTNIDKLHVTLARLRHEECGTKEVTVFMKNLQLFYTDTE